MFQQPNQYDRALRILTAHPSLLSGFNSPINMTGLWGRCGWYWRTYLCFNSPINMTGLWDPSLVGMDAIKGFNSPINMTGLWERMQYVPFRHSSFNSPINMTGLWAATVAAQHNARVSTAQSIWPGFEAQEMLDAFEEEFQQPNQYDRALSKMAICAKYNLVSTAQSIWPGFEYKKCWMLLKKSFNSPINMTGLWG